jgi:aminomethyltransferase
MIFPIDDPALDEPKPTALFSAAASSASANSWTSVNGWSVPRVYSNVADEYNAAFNAAAVADLGAVIRYTARDRDAPSFLARAVSAPVASLEPGESARGLMLDEAAQVVDIADVARLAPDLYLLSAARQHARRLQLAARGLDATVEEITGHVAALAILGPGAREAAAAAGLDVSGDNLAAQARVRGVEISVRPISFGGVPGVEVIFPYEEALTLWERLRRAVKPKPIGLDALEVIRIEGGLPRLGVDFIGADEALAEDQKRAPAALGLSHLAPVNRGWFNGRRALRADARSPRRLVSLGVDADRALAGSIVHGKKEPVGRLTSAVFSPRMKRVVAFADVAADAAAGPLTVEGPGGARFLTEFLETPESRLAAAYQASEARATDLRPRRV